MRAYRLFHQYSLGNQILALIQADKQHSVRADCIFQSLERPWPVRQKGPEGYQTKVILFEKFHIMRHLGEALDTVRKSESVRLSGKDRRYTKGQKYTLLSNRENLTLEGRETLRTLLTANKRLNTAYLLIGLRA
jgi:hypothetical protein